MSILFFDTETTGFRPGSICQLSYIVLQEEEVKSKNMYFKVEYVEPGAERVHGLSVKRLINLSNNLGFKDRFEELREDFSKAELLVAHNFNFDLNFIRSEFQRLGHKFTYKKSLCTMHYFTSICKLAKANGGGYKWPRLDELVNYLGITNKGILEHTNHIFSASGIDYHDARYDTVATYLVYRKGLERDLIKV